MTRELLILRHGKSERAVALDDCDRPLKKRGKRQAERIGTWLYQQDFLPDLVISSPAERAIATAELACKAMGMDARKIVKEKRLYDAVVDNLLGVLSGNSTCASRLMLVGHNPALEGLLTYLLGENLPEADDDKLLPTAAIARFAMPDRWLNLPAGCARLLSHVRPAELPGKFPFPDAAGKQRRNRPSYYYSQHAVIPYRIHKGHIQILSLVSAKKRHIVIPKRISDPGLSPREAAARTAFEEAGAEGLVGDEILGNYSCEKWGASCNVEVYPMQVTRLISKDEWKESHRSREWLSLAEMLKLVGKQPFSRIITSLHRYLDISP